jgi:hypothetical protein
MSHSPGQVLDVIGEIVGYFEHNGTVDVARAKIFATAEERDAAWRQDQPDPCSCHGSDVTLVTEGFRWEARACLDHGFIVHGRSPIYGREDDPQTLAELSALYAKERA